MEKKWLTQQAYYFGIVDFATIVICSAIGGATLMKERELTFVSGCMIFVVACTAFRLHRNNKC